MAVETVLQRVAHGGKGAMASRKGSCLGRRTPHPLVQIKRQQRGVCIIPCWPHMWMKKIYNYLLFAERLPGFHVQTLTCRINKKIVLRACDALRSICVGLRPLGRGGGVPVRFTVNIHRIDLVV
jgi:hypothetical protein